MCTGVSRNRSVEYALQLCNIHVGTASSCFCAKYLQENFPVYMEIISQALADLVQFTVKTWQKITDAF